MRAEQVHVDPWAWAALVGLVLVLLAVDLVAHRKAHVIEFREALAWVGFYVAAGLLFGVAIWAWMGPTSAAEYYAGYVVEFSLSIDNVFVFVLIFSYFAVPPKYQHQVLLWGVLGAIVFRAIFIFAGVALLERFDWLAFVFGAFLVFTGVRMALHKHEQVHPERNPVLRALRRVVPVSADYHGQRFLIKQAGKWVATPLFAVLVVIETTDIVFAIDSVPAILAITTNTFIVFAANAFAILGLRSLYFVLAGMMRRFVYLQLGLSVLLVFVGAKMFANNIFGKTPIEISLPVILGVLVITIAASLVKTRGLPREPLPGAEREPPDPEPATFAAATHDGRPDTSAAPGDGGQRCASAGDKRGHAGPSEPE